MSDPKNLKKIVSTEGHTLWSFDYWKDGKTIYQTMPNDSRPSRDNGGSFTAEGALVHHKALRNLYNNQPQPEATK